MNSIDTYNFEGKRALVRVDFNVPLDTNRKITDGHRIDEAFPTIRKILEDGGSVVLLSHLGRPGGKPNEKYSLLPVYQYLKTKLTHPVNFAKDCVSQDTIHQATHLNDGEVLLVENVRFHPGEQAGEATFAEALSQLGDVYVNDAFATAHRKEASTYGVAQYFEEKMIGLLVQKELTHINRVIQHMERPFTAIVGGAKVKDKIKLLESLLDKVDFLLLGGAMANAFCQKAALSTALQNEVEKLIQKAQQKEVSLVLPIDVVAAETIASNASKEVTSYENLKEGWHILDIGPQTCEEFSKIISASKTILWNGPMGKFEWPQFRHGTEAIAQTIKEATSGPDKAYSLIGGGDSAAAIKTLGVEGAASFVSTGGGALLYYIEHHDLPLLKAIQAAPIMK